MRDNIIRLQSYYAEQPYPFDIASTFVFGSIYPIDLLAKKKTQCIEAFISDTQEYCHYYHLAGLSTENSIISCRFNGKYLPINNPLSFAMSAVHRHSPFWMYTLLLKSTGIDGERCEQKSARIQLAVSLIAIVIILRLIT